MGCEATVECTIKIVRSPVPRHRHHFLQTQRIANDPLSQYIHDPVKAKQIPRRSALEDNHSLSFMVTRSS